jgi:hypothetical protein
MGSILTPAIDAIRKIDAPAAAAAHAALVTALAVKANGVAGYRPQHGPNGGECALTLGSLPVLVKYELTFDLCGSEIAEVTEVGINGHVIEAGDFAADIRAEWGSQCMQLRGGL